ncbi:MAG: ABC transporter permease subunit, partial [Firmicutes bacterium]|nr:ABC transporter permease subunit [Bacillota bacterium]
MTQSMLFIIFYGMMTTILPGIYVLVTANKLLSSQVDSGSLACVLSTPTRRSTVVFTQMISLVVMFAVQTVAHLIANNIAPVALAKLATPN